MSNGHAASSPPQLPLPSSSSSSSSQGLTRQRRPGEPSAASGGGDRIAGLTMAHRAMRLKGSAGGASAAVSDAKRPTREISPRRQVGDAADEINASPSTGDDGVKPWWKNVGMEEGM